MNIVVIDHRDSFTYNIVHLLAKHGTVRVVDFEAWPVDDCPDDALIVLSPGPGRPEDYPEIFNWYKKYASCYAVLGICLGFQMMLYAHGASIVRQGRVLHGVRRELAYTKDCATYRGFEGSLYVGRYHALVVDKNTVPDTFFVTAHDPESFAPLSIEHLTLPHFAIQYHPDSFLTEHGERIIANICRELGRRG